MVNEFDGELIPKNAHRVDLLTWGCGDECACKQHKIIAHTITYHDKDYTPVLWEGSWMSMSDGVENPQEIMAELKAACLFYNLPFDETWDITDYPHSYRSIQQDGR